MIRCLCMVVFRLRILCDQNTSLVWPLFEEKLLLQAAVLTAVLALSRVFYLQKYLLFARSVR
jgi:hypothetical protein